MYRTIVVGYDDSDQAQDALSLAEALATPGSELAVCCVYPEEAWAAPLPPLPPDQRPRAEADRRLDGARRRLGDRAGVASTVRPASSPARGMHAEVEQREADLLVVGSSHRGPLGRVVPGSVTEQALHAAPCAVAVAPAGLRDREASFERIGVGFDHGDEARHALDVAAGLAHAHGAALRLVSAFEVPGPMLGWAGAWAYPEIRDDLQDITRRHADEALATVRDGVHAEATVVQGGAVRELVLASADLDLLVLGSRGYGPLRRAIAGTVSGRVVRGAACPVLVVPRAAPVSESATSDPAASAATTPLRRGARREA